ncbi:TPA: hypothetical protein ACH3X2_001065 [Trebouxia sp. C0005]
MVPAERGCHMSPAHQGSDQCILKVCEGVIHAGKEADSSELRRAVPLELGCIVATHLTSMACKVSVTDCPDVGIGKRRGRQVKLPGANGCLVAKDLGPSKA